MKHTRLTLVLAATTLLATPAIAASLTMLQFGSFETREEAQKRLDEVKSKHAAQVGTLPSSIREVKLPPDNLTVYRTQAGPVANRAAAQSICAQMASSGDECYIVQTAMVAASDVPVAAAAPITAPVASVLNNAKAETAAAVDANAPDLTSKLSTLQQTLPARDVSNREALSSVSVPSLEVPAVAAAPVVAAEPSPEMKAALDKAIADEAVVHDSLSKATAMDTTPKAERGFWARLNPFSSSSPAPAKPAAVIPESKAAPVEAVTSAAIEPVVAPLPEVSTPAVVAKVEPQPLPQPTPVAPVVSVAPLPTILTQPEPMRLPPPPAPLRAQDREQLAMAQTAARPVPVTTGSITPVAPVIPTAPVVAAVAPAAGTVNVEEAKRVPVTETAVAPVLSRPPVMMQPLQPAVPLNPSATNGMKTVWAQVGPFADNASAMNFWNSYRQTHPDFPVVRVRVTSPLQQANQSWLRVGPVTRAAFVNNLCSNMPKDSGLRCGTVTDLGISSSPQAAKPGLLSGARYKR